VLDVVYALPLLADSPPRERPALVGRLAAALSHGLNDHHSTAWYARLIWQASKLSKTAWPHSSPSPRCWPASGQTARNGPNSDAPVPSWPPG
jgi:hypothetical protein